ncbi:Increased DNA methylation 1 [Cardamine amara subsp. amara]|uniref:Increased DNA methylation 1 n=1 Tax=Cardamine amara subsp. amara TaxID=228776 RepID=A0ABD1BKD8_CARAN
MPAPDEEEPIFGWNSNNGGRNLRRRKLLVGDRIEVRSVEDGFLGSWYLGTVVASKKRRQRRIRYDNILSDDGTDYLVETVDVSEVVEGLNSDCTDVSDTFRGRLRPVPPKLEVDKLNLVYGLCVDVFFSEAWWEGVVFDYENGSEKRRVFFPDLGDELDADLQSLRITQDWNEGTDTWECRGKWLFLELIEKYREDNYLPVSVKQLWYDIRDRIGFARIQEWTCTTRHIWEDLMMEVIDDNLRITLNQFLHDYDAERYPHQELKLLQEASQAVSETNASPSGVLVIASQEQLTSCIDKDHTPASQRCQSMSVLTSVSGTRSESSYINRVAELSSKKPTVAHKKMILPKKPGHWQPYDCDAKSCPQAVSSYIRTRKKPMAIHVRKHLKYLGWTIEHMVEEAGRQRLRYLSPDGRLTEQSLLQVCFMLKQRDKSLTLSGMAKPPSMPCENQMNDTQEMRCIVLALPAYNRSVALGEGRKPSAETLPESETHRNEEVFKGERRNFSPRHAVQGQKKTLRVRLKPETKAQGFLSLRSKHKQKPNVRYNSKQDETVVGLRNVNLSMRRGQTSRILMGIKNRVIGRGKTRVSRSSKRVQRVITPISRNHTPRSILSWLIDNNVVLPRENIRCRNQKDDSVRKEGKLTREGIKCSCCRRIFTISGFEVHADGGSCRAAANIFLDDGRSLLECQVEAYKTRKKAQPPDILKIKLRQGENDIVCAVCHYGGKLILCDGCPAAFHANCLELEDVPDGDWFCASCCCGACGQFILKDTCKYAEEKFICCKQCELKYHPSCQRYDGAGDLLDTFLGERWFCSKDCEEIFVNLSELVGKPREVGVENLTWRLVKSLEQDTLIDTYKIEAIAENHCKLSVALDVMHELFEPVKSTHGGGDLAEDVIFSRWSKYKRLNFSGFYTLLLERNDELVTVATVRIFGKKVAEMPFIGTRFQHRHSGMCRVLINELEKVLIDLGVERLVLPAVPSVLNTWTNSFGFTKMTISEKNDFLKFTFLEFGRTIMCQKILIKNNVADPIPSTVSLGEPQCDILMIEYNAASDDRSEVHQAEQHIEESISTKNPAEGIKTHQEGLVKNNRFLKCYTRRRLKCMRLT